MIFFIATKNKKKLTELSRMLEQFGIKAICESDLDAPLPDIPETGETFEENALQKARASCEWTGLPAIADDSGLCVDALGGAPGVYSARYAGEPCDDKANNALLLKNLCGIAEADRTARFVCAVACVFPSGEILTARGTCEGSIAFAPCGTDGFGYDPLFHCAAGCFGELPPREKDAVSHRGRALQEFSQKLKTFLNTKGYNEC